MSWRKFALRSVSGLAIAATFVTAANAQEATGQQQDGATTRVPEASSQATGTLAQDDVATGADIVVTGIRQSLEAAAGIKREADQVVDSIVADDIGKFPDTTTAAALQRIPGVQVTVGSNNEIVAPLIRGLGDVLTTLNGREIFTGAGRGFSFQDLPAEALAGADVYKSNSAELIEGGVAGLVDLKLHRPFDFDDSLIAGTIRGTYSNQADQVNPNVSLLMSDRWDTGIGEIGVLVDVSYAYNEYFQPIAFNSELRSTNIFAPDNAPRGVAAPTNVGGLVNSGNYQRPQINGSIQWQAAPGLEVYVDGLYSGFRSTYSTAFVLYDTFSASSLSDVEASDACFDALVGPSGFYEFGSPNMQQQTLCNATSLTANNVNTLTSNQASESNTDLVLVAGGFDYDADQFHLNADVSYQKSKFARETFIIDTGKRIGAVEIVTNDGGGTRYEAIGNPLGNPDDFRLTNGLYQDNANSIGDLFAVKLDASYDLDSVLRSIQVGGRVARRGATSEQIIVSVFAPGGSYATPVAGLGLPDNFLSPIGSIPQANGGAPYLVADTNLLLAPGIQRQLKAIYGAPLETPPFDPTRSFDATEKTYAGYVQGKYEVGLGGAVTVDGLVGLRVTRTDREISGSGTVVDEAGVPVVTPVSRSTSDTDLLPNASARVRFGGGLQARFAYAKTLARPAFGSLNPGLNYIVSTNPNIINSGSSGNPDLRPQKANAFDATLEYYFGQSDYVSVGLFYKDIKDRIVSGVDTLNIGGIDYQISRPRNLGSAKLKGLEASGQKFFDFLPGALSGLGAFANFTYLDGTITTPGDPLEDIQLLGVSKYNYNAGLIYEKYGLSVRSAYTYRSRYFDGDLTAGFSLRPVEQDIFLNGVRPNGRLDISVNYDLTRNLTLSFDAINVTKSKYKSFYDIERNPRDIRSYDDMYAAGLRFRF